MEWCHAMPGNFIILNSTAVWYLKNLALIRDFFEASTMTKLKTCQETREFETSYRCKLRHEKAVSQHEHMNLQCVEATKMDLRWRVLKL